MIDLYQGLKDCQAVLSQSLNRQFPWHEFHRIGCSCAVTKTPAPKDERSGQHTDDDPKDSSV